jgi:hypothetical protein
VYSEAEKDRQKGDIALADFLTKQLAKTEELWEKWDKEKEEAEEKSNQRNDFTADGSDTNE